MARAAGVSDGLRARCHYASLNRQLIPAGVRPSFLHRSEALVRSHCYGLTHPAKFIWPFSILIMATGLIGLRSAPMEMVPETPT